MQAAGTNANRRPIQARDTAWAAACARALVRLGATPNGISVASIACGGLGGLAFYATGQTEGWTRAALFVGAAAGIQLRLLCNLFDGMVAIEGGLKSKSGEIFNELPDRFADWAVLLGAGYAAGAGPHGVILGWAAALLALLTAYVRALGSAAKASAHFEGPMAKQHRMATLTVTALLAAVLVPLRLDWPLVQWALALVTVGSALTVVRRTVAIIRELEAR
jgi:phosphatidylglycerophosphate synthase